MISSEVAGALVRTTLATTVAFGLAWLLVANLRIHSPRAHRVVWLLVILQGWLLIPWTIEIEAPSAAPVAQLVTTKPPPGRKTLAIGTLGTLKSRQAPETLGPFGVATVAVAAWSAGAAMLAGMRLRRYMQVLRTLPLGRPPNCRQWQDEWQRQLQTTGIRPGTQVDLRMTGDLGPLLYWAPWCYLVLAPHKLWVTLASHERQSILRHELAHLRRHDLWKSLAIRLLALPQWFNPLVWYAVRRFDEAGEWACDDAAAGADNGGALALANSLLRAAEFTSADLPGSLAARGGVLSRRIHRLVTPRFKEESTMKLMLVPSLLAVLTALQLVRVQRVAAEESAVQNAPVGEQVDAFENAAGITLDAASAKKERLKQFLAVADRPYVIEPPDVLSIHVEAKMDGVSVDGDSEVSGLPITKPHEHLVGMDGKVSLGNRGSVYVAGMTVEEARKAVEKKLSKTLKRPRVELTVKSYNSKVVYLILQGGRPSDNVIRTPLPHPLTAEMNVGALLNGATYSNPINFDAARIELKRPAPGGVGAELVLPVAWDQASGQPTAETNHPLLPGDRVFVSTPPESSSKYYRQPPALPPTRAASPVPPAPISEPPELPAPKSVRFEMSVIEDLKGNFAEFKPLKEGGFMTADTAATLGAISILEKNHLAKRIAAPRLVCPLGQSGKLSVAREQCSLEVEVSARPFGDHLCVDVRMYNSEDGQAHAIGWSTILHKGQTTVVQARKSHGKGRAPSDDRSPVYLVVTPVLVP
jgi:beta-lactamase regulating signal transducer with metallopeptidase domain